MLLFTTEPTPIPKEVRQAMVAPTLHHIAGEQEHPKGGIFCINRMALANLGRRDFDEVE